MERDIEIKPSDYNNQKKIKILHQNLLYVPQDATSGKVECRTIDHTLPTIFPLKPPTFWLAFYNT